MLSDGVRILNFDDSVTRQTEFIQAANPRVVSFIDLGRAARLWADRRQANIIRERLDSAEKHEITFIGSGDYHYVSGLLLELFTEPFSLIVFDHHPDWDTLPPRRGCGAWVSRALENPAVEHVFLVGNASSDLSFPSILTGNRRGAQSGRVSLLPYKIPTKHYWPWSGLPWFELANAPRAVFSQALQKLLGKKVYISIDKDCLTSAHALTNWEEGCLELELLLGFLAEIDAGCEIIGLDVTGDYSPGNFTSRWKRWCSTFDHPSEFTAKDRSQAEIDAVNGSTNRRMVDLLRSFR